MLLRQVFLVGFASALAVTLTARSTIAFTLVPPQPGATSNWRPVSPYLAYDDLNNPYEGRTDLDTRLWTERLPLGGSGTFTLTLALWATASERGFFGWNFKQAEEELKGSFEIVNYLACGYRVLCGIENPNARDPREDGVGATFYLKYRPAPGDPQPGQQGRQLHWIQMVRANYGVTYPGGPAFPGLPFIDNAAKRDDPYYDTAAIPGDAGEDFVTDRPYNPDYMGVLSSSYFEAELYLVEEILFPRSSGIVPPEPPESRPREVIIYNGIKWGWKNTAKPFPPTKKFSGTLANGFESNKHKLEGLTPGSYFYAWTNNNIPSNRCNPNTYLSGSSGFGYRYDNDSSLVGDGFASAIAGTVPSNGIIDLFVGAANGGRRGEDRGSYELNVAVYDDEPAPPEIIASSSGGGGVGFERPRPGGTQQNPILPNQIQGGWQIFSNVPSCRWYDPHTPYGFEFQTLEDTLFTEILDFPVGLDNRFTVSVGDNILGEFSSGDSLDFVALLGAGVSNFKITGIDALIGDTEETAFPIQIAFNSPTGSFKMRPFSKPETPTPQSVPEPGSMFALIALGAWSANSIWKRKQR